MTTIVENDTGDFFILVEPKIKTKLRDTCSRHFNRIAYYRQIKLNKHLATLYQKINSIKTSPDERTSRHLALL